MLQLVVGIHTAPTKEEIFARLVAAVNGTGLQLMYSELEEPRQAQLASRARSRFFFSASRRAVSGR